LDKGSIIGFLASLLLCLLLVPLLIPSFLFPPPKSRKVPKVTWEEDLKVRGLLPMLLLRLPPPPLPFFLPYLSILPPFHYFPIYSFIPLSEAANITRPSSPPPLCSITGRRQIEKKMPLFALNKINMWDCPIFWGNAVRLRKSIIP
jgi:hypothetical protein